MVKVYNERENKNFEVKSGTLKEIAKQIGVNLNEFIVTVNGELGIDDRKVEDNDEVKFFSVVSGG